VFKKKKLQGKSKQFLCSIFFPKNNRVDKVMWKNIAKPGRPQMKVTH
jgi:hypothetical protein